MSATAEPDLSPWPATRDEALRRLAAFVPHAGRDYAAQRNFDRGPGAHDNVSQLSPYLRARLVTEPEVLTAVLAAHSPSAAYKFVSEVFWRTYWKGWLEARPSVWHDYLAAVRSQADSANESRARREALERAETGATGIAPFDAWARELVETGYLHNHARMWFASIWIFTLELPWELGADFFMRHLLCGDPASNTLSWRWVGGLHTRGKTYLARAGNIARYTEGRFDPAGELAARAPALDGPSTPVERTAAVPRERPTGSALVLLHDDDAGVETLPLEGVDVRGYAGLVAAAGRSPRELAPQALAFARGAVEDAVARAPHGDRTAVFEARDAVAAAESLATLARRADVATIVAPFAPVGPVRDALDALRPALEARGIALAEIGRRFDDLAYPHATRGFFTLRKAIPGILAELGLAEPASSART